MMADILVIGANGQLARALQERGEATRRSVLCVGRPDLDLGAPESIKQVMQSFQGHAIVNAAAYTAVDQAEAEPEAAFAINAIGAYHVAAYAARLDKRLVHLSTDYVFDGSGQRPFAETDDTRPLNVYGRSKLEGENLVLSADPQAIVLRTSWVYSPFGRNFVKTMLGLAALHAEIKVVSDQWGSPTSALDLADAILSILDTARSLSPRGQVYHATGSGWTSWAGFAEHVFNVSASLGGPSAHVTPVTTVEFGAKAPRPLNSRLSNARLRDSFGIELPDWRKSVELCVARIIAEQRASIETGETPLAGQA